MLPNPNLIGLPEKYDRWRTNQAEAACRVLDTDKRFIVLGMPTGFGKSLSYMAAAILEPNSAILTSTKGLQNQLMQDFGESGLVDIRGMNNYPCRELINDQVSLYGRTNKVATCDEGPCLAGWKCDYGDSGCHYFDQKRRAKYSPVLVTNYSYWMAALTGSTGGEDAPLGDRRRIILDEAHAAVDELADHLAIEIGYWEIEGVLGSEWPDGNDGDASLQVWKDWAKVRSQQCHAIIDTLSAEVKIGAGTRQTMSRLRELKNLKGRLDGITEARGEWVHEESRDRRGRRVVRFDPVWPGEYAEKELFHGTPRVVLTSATIRPKTLELLDIGEQDYEFIEYGSSFPVNLRPVIWCPTVRVTHRTSPGELRQWAAKIDRIIAGRGDRKGIVHTVSYSRRDYLLRYSEHRDRMLTHDAGQLQECVERFRRSGRGSVLVSPSVGTGFDFPGDECRYQIITKVPFPDTRSKIMEARAKRDPHYFAYVTAQQIVQMCGRGMRSKDDWCETIVVDDNWAWFRSKYRHFMPKWFLAACKRSDAVPLPLTPSQRT